LLDEFSPHLSPPYQTEGSSQTLGLESTLQELQLHTFQADLTCSGRAVAEVFEAYPLLPGVILIEQGQFEGMISRQQFLEYLLRPHGLELFLHKPLKILHSYTRTKVLLLPQSTTIVVAAQYALRRLSELQAEPIVVQVEPQDYRLLNVHELNIAYWQIRGIETQVRYERTQVRMIQSDKMANLGRLVDGLAHEVLDPVSFIWGNLTYLTIYSQGILQLIAAYEQHLPDPAPDIAVIAEEIELDYIKQDLPRAIESIKVGAERLTKLATSLQNFCHIDEVYPKPADLHGSLDGILLLLKSRLTTEIQIVKNYGHLPPVHCYLGQLNQVFINLLTYGVDALLDQAVRQKVLPELKGTIAPPATDREPRIEVTTKVCPLEGSKGESQDPTMLLPRWVSIRIGDNGPALSQESHRQILESFSVAGRAAQENSLTMSYQIVTAKHGGRLKLRSPWAFVGNQSSAQPGNALAPTDTLQGIGTEFEILLPLL